MPELDPRLIETDSYDREAFAKVIRGLPDHLELLEHGGRLLPHFPALLEDFFGLFFKLAIRLRPEAQAPASTLLNRRVLRAAMGAPGFFEAKDETALDSARSARAASDLAHRVLALLKTGEMLLEDELLSAQQLAEEEERLARNRAAAEDLRGESARADAMLKKGVEEGERRVEQLTRALTRSLDELPPRFDAELAATADRLAQELPRFDEAAESFSRALGGGAPRTAGERLKLAEKLGRNAKLRRLAQLAGAFRADARAVRRRRRERASAEVYRVGQGADLGRLLPSEMVALRHPARRRDFLRRLHEEQLTQYELRGEDRHGRGPMVVCIDGSGSMSGRRELWAKAVALALLDVARRQGRRTRALVFSGAEVQLSTFDLNGRGRSGGRRPVDLDAVIGLAECFPGGGTDFEKPLRAALDAVRSTPLRGADIVFITDGEATVSEAFAEEFQREKRRRDLAVFAVLVDDPGRNVAPDPEAVNRAARQLGKVADRLTTVTELTSESAREIFKVV